MAKFELYLLTPDIERESYFIDLITSFQDQFSLYKKTKQQDSIEEYGFSHFDRDNNYSFNEKFSIHANAQKELSFDMVSRKMINNQWLINPFINRINIGSLVLLKDKNAKYHVLIVKSIKTDLLEINTTYSYTCQDIFSYTLIRQNEGYTIINDASSSSFIGAKSVDWWMQKICAECYISDTYIKLEEVLYLANTDNPDNPTLEIASNSRNITNAKKIIKESDSFGIGKETFSYSCDGSSSLNAILGLCELIGYSINTYENVRIYKNRAWISRYFWLEPSKIDNVLPYSYAPQKNIENFSFDQSGDSLTTVLTVKSHTIGDESVSLLPKLPARFSAWFQSTDWLNSHYRSGLFDDLLNGMVWTTEGQQSNIQVPDYYPDTLTSNKDKAPTPEIYVKYNNRIWIPIREKYNGGPLKLSWWDNKFKFSYNEPSYFYTKDEDGGAVLTNQSFTCDLRLKLPQESDYEIVYEHESIPDKFRGKSVDMYFTLPDNTEGNLEFWKTPKITLYSYSDTTEEERQFASLADKIPWLENKIIDFNYFVQQKVLTNNEYQTLMSIINDQLRIINGQLLCYAQEYYKALQTKVELLAELETSAETLHAELNAEGIVPYEQDGAAGNLVDFISKTQELNQKYKNTKSLYGAREIQNDYLNKYFKAQQRFLKNIYQFREYFNAPAGESTIYYNNYTFTLTPLEDSEDHYLSFSPKGFISISTSNIPLSPNMNFYTQEFKNDAYVYSPVSVVTNSNFSNFWVKAQNTSYIEAESGQPYNSNYNYYIKGTGTNKDFIKDVLQETYDESSDTDQYYALNETQLKQYYYFCTNNTNLYIKKPANYIQLPANPNLELNVDVLYYDSMGDKPIQYKNRTSADFKGWIIKNVDGFNNLTSPFQDTNPYEFALQHNLSNYVEEKNSGVANYFISAEAPFRWRAAKWGQQDQSDTYDNYLKYRLVTTSYCTLNGTDVGLYTPNHYYQKVDDPVNISDEEQLYWTASKWDSYEDNEDNEDKNIVWACRLDFNPIPIPHDSKLDKTKGTYFILVDYLKETKTNDNKSDFYLTPTTVYLNYKVFNPLLEALEDKFFSDVCTELYYTESSTPTYIQATEYNDESQYYVKINDKYEKAVTYNNIVADTSSKYYIENSSTLKQADFGQIIDSKEFHLQLYLNKKDNNGVVSYKHSKPYVVKFSATGGFINDPPRVISIIDEENNIAFSSTLSVVHTFDIESNNFSNGDFWYNYIDDEDVKHQILQEKALIIEQQLTEYWLQAYSASKYCNYFLPEKWQPSENLTTNKFFNRIFSASSDNKHLQFLPLIPDVAIHSSNHNSKTQSYELVWDPFGTQYTGIRADFIEPTNPVFKSLAEEMFGGVNNLYKLKLEPVESMTNTYFYVKSGGWKWEDLIAQINPSSGKMSGFSGLYGLMFKWSQGFIENELSTYSRLIQQKEALWVDLHNRYPNIFLEGVFEYPTATTSEELLQMAEYAFRDKSKPEVNYSITILDLFALKGYEGEELKIGYPILVDASEYQLDNTNMQKAIDQYLFITDISYSLRSDTNIAITVNSIKYNDKLIQKLVKLIR